MRVSLRIRGKVQGVFFRESAKQQALALGVRGWVKNLPDGSVEAAAEGEDTAVTAFIQWCHQGPELAHVQTVTVEPRTSNEPLPEFVVKR
jgi:acylphosphatase